MNRNPGLASCTGTRRIELQTISDPFRRAVAPFPFWIALLLAASALAVLVAIRAAWIPARSWTPVGAIGATLVTSAPLPSGGMGGTGRSVSTAAGRAGPSALAMHAFRPRHGGN